MFDLRGIGEKCSSAFAVAMVCLELAVERRLRWGDRFHYGGALFLPFVRSKYDRAYLAHTHHFPKIVFIDSQCVRCDLGRQFIIEHELAHHEIGFKAYSQQEFLVNCRIVGRFNVRDMITSLERNWEKVLKCGTCAVAQYLLFAKQLKDEQAATKLRAGG